HGRPARPRSRGYQEREVTHSFRIHVARASGTCISWFSFVAWAVSPCLSSRTPRAGSPCHCVLISLLDAHTHLRRSSRSMALLVRNVVLRLDEPEELLRERIGRVLGIGADRVRAYGIVRRAIDARRRDDVRKVYHLQVAVDADEKRLLRRGRPGQVSPIVQEADPAIEPGNGRLAHRPVVIGSGPAGLFAALVLAEQGYLPILLERGQDVPQRHKALHLYYTKGQFDPENNLLFGIGGAGTYSDGKLYSRTHDPLNTWVLQQLVRFGGDPNILIDAKPHLGSDKLPGICRRMVEHLRSCGAEVRYGALMSDLEIIDAPSHAGGGPHDRALTSVILSTGERIETDILLLGMGHSARDTYRMLHQRGVALQAKPFQMGVRIEHPQEL